MEIKLEIMMRDTVYTRFTGSGVYSKVYTRFTGSGVYSKVYSQWRVH